MLVRTINNIGVSDFRLGKLESALNSFERAKKLDPSFGPAFNGLGGVYFRKRNFEKAEDNLNEAMGLGYTEALFNRGTLYLYLGHYDKAIADFENAIKYGFKTWAVYNGLGRAYQESGKSEKALLNFSRSIEALPNAVAFNNRGLALARQEHYKKAIEDFGRAIELNPQFMGAKINRASIYYSLGQYNETIGDISSALGDEASFTTESSIVTPWREIKSHEYSPSDLNNLVQISALLVRGNSYLMKEEFDLAIEDFTKVTKRDSENFFGWYSFGMLYLAKGLYGEAISSLEKARTINPSFAPAYVNEASVYLEMEEYEQSIALFGKAIELNDKLAFAYTGRGTSYLFDDQFAEAIRDLSKAVELDPTDGKAYYNLGTAYAITKKYDEAENIFIKVIEEEREVQGAYLNLLNIYTITEQPEKIAEIMAKVTELNLPLDGGKDPSVGIISTLTPSRGYLEYMDRSP